MKNNHLSLRVLFWLYIWFLKQVFGLTFPELDLDYEAKIMIRVPADAPNAPFGAVLDKVKDSEGNTVPVDRFKWDDPTTDNETAVSLIGIMNEGQQVSGVVVFGKNNDDGSPALANVNVGLRDTVTGLIVLNKSVVVEVSAGEPVEFEGEFTIEGHPDE